MVRLNYRIWTFCLSVIIYLLLLPNCLQIGIFVIRFFLVQHCIEISCTRIFCILVILNMLFFCCSVNISQRGKEAYFQFIVMEVCPLV